MASPSQGGQQPPNTPKPPEPRSSPNAGARRVTRLAPSPTGALHLGNARTFLANWALARRNGWKIVLRIEDLDGPRIKEGAAESVIETLRWLGLDWDAGPLVQSHDLAPYVDAMRVLANSARAFPCALTRAEIEHAASAPHGTTGESRFPPELRPPIRPREFNDVETNWRFVVDPVGVEFTDAFVGAQRIDPSASVGDFVIWTKRAQPSYQLAVVVDDHRQGVTDVVRGDDLLDSAARQLLLYRALGFAPEPAYTHLPLVIGEDGRRLAKRHGDTRLDHYRAQDVPAERVIGLLAFWCGVSTQRRPMSASEFVSAFNIESMTRDAAVFTTEDDRWLLG